MSDSLSLVELEVQLKLKKKKLKMLLKIYFINYKKEIIEHINTKLIIVKVYVKSLTFFLFYKKF